MKRSVFVLAVLALLVQPLGLLAEPAATGQTVQVTLDLSDGSHLIGTTPLTTLPLRSETLGTMAIPIAKVRSLKFSPDHESLVVAFVNGDKLQGSLGTVALELQTLLGTVRVPWEHVATIEVRRDIGKALEWIALPFPKNSDWGGPRGQPALIGPDEIVLQGRNIRSQQTFTQPLTIECDVQLEERTASDGSLAITLVPAGAPADMDPEELIQFRMIYRSAGAYSGRDALVIEKRYGTVWGEEPFKLRAGEPYHLKLEVTSSGLRISVNGQAYEPDHVTVPFGKFHIQFGGWQPTNRWHVRNITVH